MKAIQYNQYGPPDVLELVDVKKPVCADNQVLIKVVASTVTAGDCEMRSFRLPAWLWLPLRIYMGVFRPRIKILGQDLAGTIEDIGKEVKEYKVGDRVVAPTEMSLGAHAEFICLPGHKPLVKLPESITFEEAATLPTGGLNALFFINIANLRPGNQVLINGAGGSIGTYVIQLAKDAGCSVTAVDSTSKLPMLRSIGADHVIDYTARDFTRSQLSYDVIIDVVGKAPLSRAVALLNPGGRLIIGNPRPTTMFYALLRSLAGQKKVINALAPYRQQDLLHLMRLMKAGKIRAVIDRTFELEQMQDAHRYVETGAKTGHVVIKMPA